MSLIKSEFPILERDTNPVAVIQPDRKQLYQFPEKCVFAFLAETITLFAEKTSAKIIGEFETITKAFPIYSFMYKGEEMCLCQAPLGSAASAQFMEFLIGYGCKYIISCGSCGALHDFDENEILIPIAALRDEGASYHYIAPSRKININSLAVEAIKRAIDLYGIQYEECETWTTDGFYRETRDMVEYRKSEGCSVVEMECAALAACAQFRGIVFGQILFTADSLAALNSHDDRDWGKDSHELVLDIAVESAFQCR